MRIDNEELMLRLYQRALGHGAELDDGDDLATVIHNGSERRLVTFEDLDRRYALLEPYGAPSVYVNRFDFLPIQDADLKRRLAGEVVAFGEDQHGNPKYVEAFKFWTGHADRHVYRRIVFTGRRTAADEFNLFRGLGVEPKRGECELIKAHIEEVICGSDAAMADALMKLMAWQLQNIGKPSRIIVVLQSRQQQVGKGILLGEVLGRIWGPSGHIASTMDPISGRFNTAVRGVGFIFLDEVLFAGDRATSDSLKKYSTATSIAIEEKFCPSLPCPIGLNFWLATNHAAGAFIEESDERYLCLECSPHRVGDSAYFSALMGEIENGGREAFADFLLNLDVSGFVPWRDIDRRNDAKAKMVRDGVNPYDARKWLEACCECEQILGCKRPDSGDWLEWAEGDSLKFAALSNAYVEWQKTVKTGRKAEPTPIGKLGELLGGCGFVEKRTARARLRVVPSVEDCRAHLWDFEFASRKKEG